MNKYKVYILGPTVRQN